MNNVQPRITLMTEEQVAQTHDYTLRILAETGVRIDSETTRSLLSAKLGASCLDGNRARFPAEIVKWALKTVPATIDIFDRTGQPAFTLGDGSMRYGAGVTALYNMDVETDALEPFARRHMQSLTRLAGALPRLDAVSTLGVLQDVPAPISDLYAALDMTANTTKPLVILVSEEAQFQNTLNMLEMLHGNLGEKPFIIPYFNPVTPLTVNTGTTDKMQWAIERGLPIIYSNYSMAGATTPITPAGSMALMMAELLAGLVIAQLMKEGTPMILGMLPAYFDMKTATNFYDPQSMLLNIACAEMMAHYNLPHCGTSGSGTGWGADILGADTYWMNYLPINLTRGGLAPFVGDTLTSKGISANTLVYVHEIIEQATRFANGFQLDDDVTNLAEIAKLGPGGNYLAAQSTRKLYKTGYYNSPIWQRWSLEKWQAEGRPTADSVLRKYTQHLLDTAPAPADHDEVMAKGEAFIAKIAQ